MKKKLPRAALLGTVAGIGFIWMATQGVFDVFGDPLIGLPILFVAMVGIFGGYLFPKQIPPLVVADCRWDHLCILPGKNNRRFQQESVSIFRILLTESSI